MTLEYGFGFVDILGFSQLVCDRGAVLALAHYQRLPELAWGACVGKEASPSVGIFSDCIVVYSETGRVERIGPIPVVEYLAGLMRNALLPEAGEPILPLRGSVSSQEYIAARRWQALEGVSATTPLFVGPALVAAAKWEAQQDWIGISVPPTESAALATNWTADTMATLLDRNLLLNYEVPAKNGAVATLAVNYVRNVTEAERLRQALRDSLPEVERHRRKYTAALAFIDHIANTEQYARFFPAARRPPKDF